VTPAVDAPCATGAAGVTNDASGDRLVAATRPLVEAKLREVLQRRPDARVVAIRGAGPWAGPERLSVASQDVTVVWCPSSLAVREVLAAAPHGARSTSGVVAIVTPVTDAELGADVVARLERSRVLPLDLWQVLEALFGAHGIDPRVVETRGLVDALVELAPADGYTPAASGLLDLDTAWAAILRQVLGVDDTGDLVALLDAVRSASHQGAWAGLDPALREALRTWVALRFGGAAGGIVASLDRPAADRVDPAAVGLVCEVVLVAPPDGAVVTRDEDRALALAAARLETVTGGLARGDAAAGAWADASRRYCQRLGIAAEPVYQVAQGLLDQVQADGSAHLSSTLPLGFAQRLTRFAGALVDAVDRPSADHLALLEARATGVTGHRLAARHPARVDAVRMAVRLARSLAVPPATPASFAEAASGFADDSAWADWAYDRVWGAEPDPVLAAAYERLLAAVAAGRAPEDERFGALLADWAPTGGGDVLLVENVLDQVVAPLAETDRGVLLVVLDGMGATAAAELFGDLAAQGWTEVLPPGGARQPVVGAFPTITKVCRTTLLTGRLGTGDASTESAGFAAHPRLSAASRAGRPPVLFHKPDLRAPAGRGVPDAVSAAITDARLRVVGVVVNAIDDHLAKGDQVRVPWTIAHVAPLGSLLELAATAGRVVVLTSDHGHVLERGMELRGRAEGERWRRDDGHPADDEIVLRGPRVVLGDGSIIAPWSDGVRYGTKKHGYHGGASPAEVVIPLGVFAVDAGGAQAAPPRGPAWWDDSGAAAPAAGSGQLFAPDVGRAPGPSRTTAAASDGETLAEAPRGAEPVAVAAWIDELFASPTYAEQEARAGRVALPRERVARLLGALDARGGTLTPAALARAADVPPGRLAGVLSGLVRLLNVDGYGVVTLGDDDVTLHRAILDEQFGLRPSPAGRRAGRKRPAR
jgi:hypothetical protein